MIHALLFAALGHDVQATQAQTIYRRSQAAVVTVLTPSASGTGFVVGDGSLVVTCYHVVRDGIGQVSVVGKGKATLVASNPTTDVAVLRLARRSSNRLLLSQGSAPTPGARVYVIGTPLGLLEKSITEGMLSGVRHLGDTAYLQITAPISHGSSGSPVLDAQGRVIGMAASSIKDGQALNFAISAFNLRQTLAMVATGSNEAKGARRSRPPVAVAQLFAIVTTRSITIYASPDRSSDEKYSTRRHEVLWVTRTRFPEWLQIVFRGGDKGYVPSADTKRATHSESEADAKEDPPAVSPNVRKIIDKVAKERFAYGSPDEKALVSLGPNVIPIITYELRQPNDEGDPKYTLASILTEFGAAGANSLLDLLQNGNRFEREAASSAIWEASLDLGVKEAEAVDKAEFKCEIISSKELVGAIVQNLSDKNCKLWLIPACGYSGLSAAREPLLELLGSNDPSTLELTLGALAYLATSEDVPTIEECVDRLIEAARKKRKADHPYRDEDLQRILRLFAVGESPISLKVLGDFLTNPDEVVRAEACGALAARGESDALPEVLDALQDQDIVVRCGALLAAAALGDRDHIELAIHYCRKGNALEQIYGISSIAVGKWMEGIDAVLDLVHSKDADVRRGVAVALGHLGGDRAKNALQILKRDPDPAVRKAAKESLERAAKTD